MVEDKRSIIPVPDPTRFLTFTGKLINPFAPEQKDICIEDIAHSLSNQCRFGGHFPTFYSVAQHSVIVSRMAPKSVALAALLHDAAEAYLIDLPRPVKNQIAEYGLAEYRVTNAIARKFGFTFDQYEQALEADEVLLEKEWRYMQGDRSWEPNTGFWTPHTAKSLFMKRYYSLIGGQLSFEGF